MINSLIFSFLFFYNLLILSLFFTTQKFKFYYFIYYWGIFSLFFLRWDSISLWALPVSGLCLLLASFKLLATFKLQPKFWRTITMISLCLPTIPLWTIVYPKDYPTFDISPVVKGPFIVVQGGDWPFFNHHYPVKEQQFAADILRIKGPRLSSKTSIFSERLEDFASFNEEVFSPCDGTVIEIENSLPNEKINQPSKSIPSNFVAIECPSKIIVKLLHLNAGSITVKPGDMVKADDYLGKIGNSGNSSEPHLHIQANEIETGASIRLSYKGIPLTRSFLLLF